MEKENETVSKKSSKSQEIGKPFRDSLIYKILSSFFVFFCFFAGGICFTCTGITLVDMIEFTNTTEVFFSSIFLVKSSGMIIPGLLVGTLSDLCVFKLYKYKKFYHLSLNYIMVFGVVLMCIPNFIIPTVSVGWISIASNFLTGFGFQILLVVCTIQIETIWCDHGARLRNILQFLLHFCYGTSSFLFPLIIGTIYGLELSSKDNLIITYGVALLVSLVPLGILWLESPEKGDKVRAVGQNEENKKVPKKVKNFQKEKQTVTVKILRIVIVIFAFLCLTTYVCIDAIAAFLLFSYLVEKGTNKQAASYASSVYFGFYTLGRGVGVVASSFLPAYIILGFDCALLTICYLIFTIFPSNVVLIFILIAPIAFAICTMFTSTIACCKNFNMVLSGFENSIIMFGACVGNFSPFIAQQIMSYTVQEVYVYSNFGLSILLCIIFCVFIALGFIFRKMTLKEISLKTIQNEKQVYMLINDEEIQIGKKKDLERIVFNEVDTIRKKQNNDGFDYFFIDQKEGKKSCYVFQKDQKVFEEFLMKRIVLYDESSDEEDSEEIFRKM